MSLKVVRATEPRLRPALKVLYSGLPAEEQASRVAEVESLAASDELDLSHLLLAEQDDQPVGALMLSIPESKFGTYGQPGVGTLWPPVVLPQISDAKTIEDLLLEKAAWWLDSHHCWIGQSLLLPDQIREREVFQRNGFGVLTELIFFECDLSTTTATLNRSKRLISMPYRALDRLRLSNLLADTYQRTLDCPELNGICSPIQSLEQLEASGQVVPKLWQRYQLDCEVVGLLLSVNRPESQAREVVYLGVVEHARRQGIGREMLIDSMNLARQDGIHRLLIAADIRNHPARRLYESLGFTEIARKVACVRFNPSKRSSS